MSEKNNQKNLVQKRPRIAWLSPFPPQRSGVANYSFWLLKALRPFFDIHLYYSGDEPIAELKQLFNVDPISKLVSESQQYSEIIYHLGNNSLFHTDIYKLAWDLPGTIVLHDYNLSAFMHEAFYRRDGDLYKHALNEGYVGSEHKPMENLLHRMGRNIGDFPMSQAIVNRSKKVVVHHRWVRDQFDRTDHITVIPHFARISCLPTTENVLEFKQRFGIKDDHFLISCVGFINSNKLPALQIEVVKRLLDHGYPVQLIFAGETAVDVRQLESEVRTSQLAENIRFTGYLSEADYFSAIFASDVILNLRNPSMGEASGTLMHALAAGKPTIVSDLNQYREFPDRVCWKVAHDGTEVDVLYAYLTTLLSDKRVRSAMAANAREYADVVFALERVVPQWLRLIAAS